MITSTSNAKVKWLQSLQKKSKVRREEKLFIIEGTRFFQDTDPERIQEIYVAESAQEGLEALLEHRKYQVMSDAVFASVCDTKTPQGILAVGRQPENSLSEMLAGEHPLLLILEDLQDPGNLGTIVRTAEGAGVDGIILTPNCVDIYNPKVVRSTMGAIYRMPFLYLEGEEELDKLLAELRQKHIQTYAAALTEAKDYDQYPYTEGTAFLIGNEGNGLKEKTISQCDHCVKIPMCGQVESLNAAVAAAILMYEGSRQRRFQGN
ncbi:MAG: RNA methyltransferase [Lachnospiraceae bacterium]|nr:RNA methyltransferase [Lachnospiraceae bacterium]